MEYSRTGELLCISGGDKTYALEFAYVAEISTSMNISKIPALPPHFLGVCNNRGQIIPVIGKRGDINEAGKHGGQGSIMLIIENKNYRFAILLDREPYIVTCEDLSRVKSEMKEMEGSVWAVKEIWKSDTEIISLVDVERTIEKLILYK